MIKQHMIKQYNSVYSSFINQSKLYRIPSLAFAISGLVYLLWLSAHLNSSAILFAFVFFSTQLFNYLTICLSMFNHWNIKYRSIPPISNIKPDVAVVIPTYKEPVEIVNKTLDSINQINYEGKIVVVLSNDYRDKRHKDKLNRLISSIQLNEQGTNKIYEIIHTKKHNEAKAGNLNQAIRYIREKYPQIDFVLTQDADEIVYPEILNKLTSYFIDNPKVAFVQSIKQVKVPKSDPFGNHDYMWYGRTAPARDTDNAMIACGSGVVWKISAIEDIGGYNTWNLVEDLTTSYELLAAGWESRYHYEPLSRGLAPEDLPNFIKQRGTWSLDALRIFFWDNPLLKKGLSWKQKLHFLEIPMFYLNGIALMGLVITTSLSLIFEVWPTNASALMHALYLLPMFIALEFYYILLAGKIPLQRTREYWVSLSPIFALSAVKALFYGPNRKPSYKVTNKENQYGNYLGMALAHIGIVTLILLGILRSVFSTPLYSRFDWAVFFWGLYIASYFVQFIRVSVWKWKFNPQFNLGAQIRVVTSYLPDSLNVSSDTTS